MKEISPLRNDQILKINEQMTKSLCAIDLGKAKGTGFFCKIPFPDNQNLLPTLITCNHLLNEEYINKNKTILIFLNNRNEKREILMENRITYTNRELDITIIEIKTEKDNINNFLELEKFDKDLQKLSVYFLQYAKGEECLVSFGIIRAIKEKDVIHDCWSDFGSAGGPIISSIDGKAIAIHKGSIQSKGFKIGTLLSDAILEFQKLKK